MLALRSTVEHFRRLAEMYRLEIDVMRGAIHQAELKSIKFETLADSYRFEIERLERIIAGAQPADARGGFVNQLEAESDEPEADDSPAFAERLDEIYGIGLSTEEIEHRHEAYRQRQIEALQAERAAILQELHGSP